ncbi:MAG: hypothetical protein U9R14_04350 [Patescibacteria group bacterium]|nr:hypothetical protein [Patescibacteria group bacterium]
MYFNFRFQDGRVVEKEDYDSAKEFGKTIDPSTTVWIYDEDWNFIEECKVSDIWDFSNESYQQRVSNQLKKK